MRVSNISKMKRGWFIGNFAPSLYKTEEVEVAVKEYKAGEYEKKHFHKVATEYTVIVEGKIKMFNREFERGDIVITEPGDVTDFIAVTDAVNVVVKIPGARSDKYEV